MSTREAHENDRADMGGPIAIVVGLGVVVIANVIMISLALSRPSIPATTDHWAESLVWEQELERRAHSRALGWSVRELARDRDALALSITDADHQPITGLSGSVTLRRADRGTDDHTLTLIEVHVGRYRSEQTIPDAGLYELSVALRDPAGDEFVDHRWLELDHLERIDQREPEGTK